METQNITLSIPKVVLRKTKLIVVQRQTSLSRLLTQALLEIIPNVEGYEHHHGGFLVQPYVNEIFNYLTESSAIIGQILPFA
jgi:hypothetical protein